MNPAFWFYATIVLVIILGYLEEREQKAREEVEKDDE